MKKIQSFHLPKLTRQQNLQLEAQCFNQLAAEQSLFQISKLEEHRIHERDNILRDLSRQSSNIKRYQRSSLSLPKKREIQQPSGLDLRTFRQTFLQHSNNHESIGITNFLVIDNRKIRGDYCRYSQPKSDRNSLQQHINRKAKYLFRTRNRQNKSPLNDHMFVQSFYCSKIQSTAAEDN